MTTYRTSVTVLAQIAVQSYANSNIYKANNPLSVGSPRNPLTTAQNRNSAKLRAKLRKLRVRSPISHNTIPPLNSSHG
jgi:hypothetical protein